MDSSDVEDNAAVPICPIQHEKSVETDKYPPQKGDVVTASKGENVTRAHQKIVCILPFFDDDDASDFENEDSPINTVYIEENTKPNEKGFERRVEFKERSKKVKIEPENLFNSPSKASYSKNDVKSGTASKNESQYIEVKTEGNCEGTLNYYRKLFRSFTNCSR